MYIFICGCWLFSLQTLSADFFSSSLLLITVVSVVSVLKSRNNNNNNNNMNFFPANLQPRQRMAVVLALVNVGG